jgi:hypothetical protein
MRDLRFATVHEALLEALPELRPCYERLFDDWDNFGGEPPGQYIVFPDVLGRFIEILLTLPEDTAGRRELLQRAIDLGEEMLQASDREVRSLGIDSVADTFDLHPAGRWIAQDLGGPELRRWFESNSRDDWERHMPRDSDIIDLWGVRAVVADLLPEVPLNEVPEISHPADYLALSSLEDAQQAEDGTVLLSTYGTTRPYVVASARLVSATHDTLDEGARDLALSLHGNDALANAGVHYRRIPPGERVWNLETEEEKHSRLTADPWILPRLSPWTAEILDLLAGRIDRLPSTMLEAARESEG